MWAYWCQGCLYRWVLELLPLLKEFGIPALGTMAHNWVQMFPTEEESLRAYARVYPDNCVLLVDTYNVLNSGIPNAIRYLRRK